MEENSKLFWIIAVIIALAIGAAGGYYYGNKIGYQKAGNDAKAAAEAEAKKTAEAANPFKAAQTNPLNGINTNPLESIKFNPFK